MKNHGYPQRQEHGQLDPGRELVSTNFCPKCAETIRKKIEKKLSLWRVSRDFDQLKFRDFKIEF